MITDSDLTRHNVAETVRVWREGGTGRVVLPGAKPGTVMVGEINQNGAEEMVAWLTDRLMDELRMREECGERLSETEQAALAHWRGNVAHAWAWAAPRGGPSFVQPLNARGEPIGEKVVLARHPAEYHAHGVGWLAPKYGRAPGFKGPIRLDLDSRGPAILIDILRFPHGADLFTALVQFGRLNAEWGVRRLSPEDRRRHLLPYGADTLPNGNEAVFNREYQPIRERQLVNGRPNRRWFYDDSHTETEKRQRAGDALDWFLAGAPPGASRTRH